MKKGGESEEFNETMNGLIHFLTSKLVSNVLELGWKIKKDAFCYLLNLMGENKLIIYSVKIN